MSADSGPGNREVAYRLFAAEFEDATVSYSESDEERAPNYVITPTGGRVNRVFLAGVLTETERVGGEQIRGRIVDPTGAFVAYAGQYQPDELAFLDRADPPAFLAVTGKARTFSPEDSDRVYTSVRPESISEVDAETRDRWVVRTAEQTLDRVATMASALRSDLRGEALRDRLVEEGVDAGLASGVALAVEHYGTTSAYLQALRGTALDAVRVVAGERDEVDRLDLAPDEGGTEDAVLGGLATMDLGATTPAPGVAADEPASTATTDLTDTAADEPTGTGGSDGTDSGPAETTTDTEATEAGIDTDTEPEPGPTTEPEPEPEETAATTTAETEPSGAAETVETGSTDAGTDTGAAEPTTPTDEPEAVGTDGVDEPATTGATGPDEPAADAEEDFEDFEPGEFELPEEEREEIEAEFGTDFETAGEVDPAGEAGIETPESEGSATGAGEAAASTPEADPASEPETTAEPGTEAEAETDAEADAEAGSEPEPEPEPEPTTEPDDAAAEEVDVDEVTVAVIAELDDGDGADREAVVETVAERHGVDPEAVAEAIEDAMMSGRAYEPSDGRLKAI